MTAELTAIEHALVRAWVERDQKAIKGILAKDWTVIDFAGRVLTKAEVVREGFRSQDRQIESGAIDGIQVRALDDVAIVTGRSVVTGTYRGNRATVTQRFADVFVKRSGRWQVVASQGTRVSQ